MLFCWNMLGVLGVVFFGVLCGWGCVGGKVTVIDEVECTNVVTVSVLRPFVAPSGCSTL